MKLSLPKLSEITVVFLVALFITVFHNKRFFLNIAEAYGPEFFTPTALVGGLHFALLLLGLLLLGSGRLLRWALALVVVLSASWAYFIDTYNVIIDADMIDNGLKTDLAEVRDLLSPIQGMYILLLGLLPAWLIIKLPAQNANWHTKLLQRLSAIGGVASLMGLMVFASADFYASYLREQKVLRYYSNPLATVYGAYRFAEEASGVNSTRELQIIAQDAVRIPAQNAKPKLTIMVVGETVRADHFGLNGYERNTTPLMALEAEQGNLVNFTQVSSCGTSTAYSLPCMFSYLGRSNYDKLQAKYQQNALDILSQTGVDVLWLDNNSSSKGVADRLAYLDVKTAVNNPICDSECRDLGMLQEASKWLDKSQLQDDKLLVLHQMGSHGPAYYKRYPQAFEIYEDTCKSNQLDTCTQQQIINAYDNTIVYTDYFLAQTIQWLEEQQTTHDVAMLYISDHGESLGENGLYLHGYPYMFAPKAQTQVPMVLWASADHSTVDLEQVRKGANEVMSHDNLFHTLLGLYGVEAGVYKAGLDVLK